MGQQRCATCNNLLWHNKRVRGSPWPSLMTVTLSRCDRNAQISGTTWSERGTIHVIPRASTTTITFMTADAILSLHLFKSLAPLGQKGGPYTWSQVPAPPLSPLWQLTRSCQRTCSHRKNGTMERWQGWWWWLAMELAVVCVCFLVCNESTKN